MKEQIRKSLLELGGINLQVKESKKTLESKRKKLFVSLIDYYLLEKTSNKKIIVNTPIQLYNIVKKFKLFKTT